MNLSRSEDSLWNRLSANGPIGGRYLRGAQAALPISILEDNSGFNVDREQLRQQSVLIAAQDQLTAAMAMIELDGVARRLVLLPPGVSDTDLLSVMDVADIDAVVVGPSERPPRVGAAAVVHCTASSVRPQHSNAHGERTEWVLFTSGTTSAPKLVSHTLSSLAGSIQAANSLRRDRIWSTFYDIRRYGGLQILLRALLGGGSMVLSDARESVADFMRRAADAGVTHLTGTPSHWRRLLMSQSAHVFTPAYVRLSGEIVDQPLLDSLLAAYPAATIVHAFASTEAGLAFEVGDGLAGFPSSFVDRHDGEVEVRLENGSMLIRSARTASRYLNLDAPALRRDDGFVDTGDLVELRQGRYYFIGRRGGIINVGGLKCHPEEIESVINRHPMVHMSLVRARKNAVLGAIVVAEVVLKSVDQLTEPTSQAIKDEILVECRRSLSAHKVPASIRIMDSLEVSPSGKLVRPIV